MWDMFSSLLGVIHYNAQAGHCQMAGLKRNRWDGVVVVEYLERIHGVRLKVRQSQRWIRRLGFSLRQPIYRYAQATTEGVEEFRKTVKKTPDDQEK